jgi:hypothetical protein
VFENRGLRRTYGPKSEELAEEWRKAHNEELHNFYSSAYIIRKMKSRRMWGGGDAVRMRKMINAYRILIGKPEGKIPLRRHRCT